MRGSSHLAEHIHELLLDVQAYSADVVEVVVVEVPPYALAGTAVQFCWTHVLTWLLEESPPPKPPGPPPPPSMTYLSCPEATNCWSLATVIAESLPVNPNMEITARPD